MGVNILWFPEFTIPVYNHAFRIINPHLRMYFMHLLSQYTITAITSTATTAAMMNTRTPPTMGTAGNNSLKPIVIVNSR